MKIHLVFDVEGDEEASEIIENLADASDRDEQANDMLRTFEFEAFVLKVDDKEEQLVEIEVNE